MSLSSERSNVLGSEQGEPNPSQRTSEYLHQHFKSTYDTSPLQGIDGVLGETDQTLQVTEHESNQTPQSCKQQNSRQHITDQA